MLYLFLIAVWPILNYVEANFFKLNNYSDVLVILGTSLVFSCLVGNLIKKYSKDPIERYLFVFFVLSASFFYYAHFVDALGGLPKIPYIKSSYIWLLVSCLLSYGAWKSSRSLEIQKVTKLLIATVIIVPLCEMGHAYWFLEPKTVVSTQEQTPSFHFRHKPNVYYILVDAYGRQDTLKETAGFNNEPFLHDLEKAGFIIGRNAFSNYHFTGASLPATMSMRYHQFSSNNTIDYSSQMHEQMKGDNHVRKIFKKNGYKIINIPAHWQQMVCYGFEDKCIMHASLEVYHSFLSSTPFRVIKLKNNYVELEDIKNSMSLFPGEPKFVFAHLAQVHDAIYDEKERYHSCLHPAYSSIQEAQRYINSIKVINEKLLNLVKYIKEKDKEAIIIIQADHGPTYTGNLIPKDPSYWLARVDDIRLQTKDDVRYSFGILSAVYFPPTLKNNERIKDYFSQKPSLVNTFRYLFAYLSGQEPQLLNDESHFLYYDQTIKAYREADMSHLKP